MFFKNKNVICKEEKWNILDLIISIVNFEFNFLKIFI